MQWAFAGDSGDIGKAFTTAKPAGAVTLGRLSPEAAAEHKSSSHLRGGTSSSSWGLPRCAGRCDSSAAGQAGRGRAAVASVPGRTDKLWAVCARLARRALAACPAAAAVEEELRAAAAPRGTAVTAAAGRTGTTTPAAVDEELHAAAAPRGTAVAAEAGRTGTTTPAEEAGRTGTTPPPGEEAALECRDDCGGGVAAWGRNSSRRKASASASSCCWRCRFAMCAIVSSASHAPADDDEDSDPDQSSSSPSPSPATGRRGRVGEEEGR